MGDRHDHLLALDQVFVLELVKFRIQNFGAARRGKGLAGVAQFPAQQRHQLGMAGQNIQVTLDLFRQLLQFLADLAAPQCRQAMQAQVQDGLHLALGELVFAVLNDIARLADQLQVTLHVAGRPGLVEQRLAGRRRALGGADHHHDLVYVGHRHHQPDQQMRALPRLRQIKFGAPGNHFLAEIEEGLQNLLQIHLLRPAAVQCQHVAAKTGLQWRVAEQLVQHNVGHRIALQLDDHAHAAPVALVAQVRYAFNAPAAHTFGDFLDQPGFVHLIGNLGGDNGEAILANFLDCGARANPHAAPPGVIGRANAGAAHDDGAGGEIRAGNKFHQRRHVQLAVVGQRQGGVNHLAQIMGRDVGGHANRNAAGAVDQQVGKARRQYLGFKLALVVIGDKIDRVLGDVRQQLARRLRQAGFGIAHGRSRVAVHAAEIALSVDQHQAQGKILGQPHQGIVNRGITVGVILAHHVADNTRRLLVGLVEFVAALVHGIENATMHRLQAVAHVGQRPRDDHAHGVIQIRGRHLLFDGNLLAAFFRRLRGRGGRLWRVAFVVQQIGLEYCLEYSLKCNG